MVQGLFALFLLDCSLGLMEKFFLFNIHSIAYSSPSIYFVCRSSL